MDLWRKLGDLGLHGMTVPEEYGGSDMGYLAHIVALEEISLPMHIWHGEADGNSPVAAARYLAQAIPNSLPRILPDEGHFSMLRHLPEMVQMMTAVGSQSSGTR